MECTSQCAVQAISTNISKLYLNNSPPIGKAEPGKPMPTWQKERPPNQKALYVGSIDCFSNRNSRCVLGKSHQFFSLSSPAFMIFLAMSLALTVQKTQHLDGLEKDLFLKTDFFRCPFIVSFLSTPLLLPLPPERMCPLSWGLHHMTCLMTICPGAHISPRSPLIYLIKCNAVPFVALNRSLTSLLRDQ